MIEKSLFFYLVFLVNELFIHIKVGRANPGSKVTDASAKAIDCMSFDTRVLLSRSKNAYELARRVSREKECKFLDEKIGGIVEIVHLEILKKDVIEKAMELVKSTNGNYIYAVDIYVSYLFLQEDKTHELQKNDLLKDDLVYLLYWARRKYGVDHRDIFDIPFTGSGIFDFFVYGWNEQTKKYSINFTQQTLRSSKPLAVGRENEYELLINSLSKTSASNVLLVGPPGVGKASLVSLFAQESYGSSVPRQISRKIVFQLLTDKLLAGVNSRGELEERLGLIFEEIIHSENTIIFIPNMESMFGGGGFDFDISGVLSHYLEGDKIRIIGTTTKANYQTYIYPKQSIKELFDIINIDQPDNETALFMLFEKTTVLEKTSGINITYGALKSVIDLVPIYIPSGHLPGSAIHLLEEVISKTKNLGNTILRKQEVVSLVEQKTNVKVSRPKEEEIKILLDLESEMKKKIISQDEAVTAISKAMRRSRSGLGSKNRPISSFLFLGPTGVGKTATAKALAEIYFGDKDNMIRLDMSEFQRQESIKKLLGGLPGETYIANNFVDRVLRNPFSLILLDEFEKAHPQILNLFLQVFDEARLTDNKGREISFKNNIIIATSNAGSEFIRENIETNKDAFLRDNLVDHLLKESKFRPELLNRFDDIIVFNPLSKEAVKKITKLFLNDLSRKLEKQHMDVDFTEDVIEKIAKDSFNQEFGARNMRRYIEQNVENLISKKILEGELSTGDSKSISVDQNGQLIFGGSVA